MSQRRGRSLTPILLALVVGFLLLMLVLVMFFSNTASTGMTLSNGRNVTFYSDSWSISSESDGDRCTTRTAGRTIVVDGESVSVDGRQLATMDPATKDLAVTVGNGKITVVADGATIATVPR